MWNYYIYFNCAYWIFNRAAYRALNNRAVYRALNNRAVYRALNNRAAYWDLKKGLHTGILLHTGLLAAPKRAAYWILHTGLLTNTGAYWALIT